MEELTHDQKAKYRMRKLYTNRRIEGTCISCGDIKDDSNRCRCKQCEDRQKYNSNRLKEYGNIILRVKTVKNYTLYNEMIRRKVNVKELSILTGVSQRNVTKWVTLGSIPKDPDVRELVNNRLETKVF